MPLDALPATIGNSSFSTKLPNLQLAWDSTSIGELKSCPYKYRLGILEGWSPRRTSVHLEFGLLYHAALERYDHKKSDGLDHESAMESAIGWLLEATWDKALNRPWVSDHAQKNRLTLVRTVVWYLDQFADDPLKTVQLASGRPAVELSFRMDLGFGYVGEGFALCGHLDRVATLGDKVYIVDRKTTGTTITQDFFSKFSPDNQFSTYALGATVIYSLPVVGLIVDGAQVATTFSRFQRGLVYRTPEQLAEWHADLTSWLASAASYAERGHWPQNDKSCNMWGGCQFRGICSKSPAVRGDWLKAEFTHRVWNPLEVRGDI